MKAILMLPKFLRSLFEGSGYFEELKTAIQNKDGSQVEKVIRSAFQSQGTDEIQPLMAKLCVEDWHWMHEDIVGLLQEFGEIEDVSALEHVVSMNFSYLEYDEHFSLARKATWALADIGGSEARQALERIVERSNPTIAGYAKKRLMKWDVEHGRKRN